MIDETVLRENMMKLDTAKAQLEGLARQQELIQLAIEEHVKARETVKSLSTGASGDDLMIPIGADSYIYAKASERKDVVIGVGSGVSVQRDAVEAQKLLEIRIEELSQGFQKVSEKANQVEATIQQLSQLVQSQYEEMQAGQIA